MRIHLFELVIQRGGFRIAILAIHHKEGCYAWDLISVETGIHYAYADYRKYRSFSLFGVRDEVFW